MGYVFWETAGYPDPGAIAFGGGPSAFPRVLAGILLLLLVVLSWSAMRPGRGGRRSPQGATASKLASSPRHGVVFAQIVLLLLLLPVFVVFGFVLASVIFLAVSMSIIVRPRRVKDVLQFLIYAVVISLGIFGVFDLLIGVPLPRGFLG